MHTWTTLELDLSLVQQCKETEATWNQVSMKQETIEQVHEQILSTWQREVLYCEGRITWHKANSWKLKQLADITRISGLNKKLITAFHYSVTIRLTNFDDY